MNIKYTPKSATTTTASITISWFAISPNSGHWYPVGDPVRNKDPEPDGQQYRWTQRYEGTYYDPELHYMVDWQVESGPEHSVSVTTTSCNSIISGMKPGEKNTISITVTGWQWCYNVSGHVEELGLADKQPDFSGKDPGDNIDTKDQGYRWYHNPPDSDTLIIFTRPEPFEWTNAPNSGKTISLNLKASDINNLLDIATKKEQWTFNNENSGADYANHKVQVGDLITASCYNTIAADCKYSGRATANQTVITADHFLALADTVNTDLY